MIDLILTILDLTSERKEKMSEGWLLWELMRILELEKKVKFDYVTGKKHFFELLNEVSTKYLHIGAHGDQDKGQTGLLTPRGAFITSDDIEEKWLCRKKPELVVLSACKAGRVELINKISNLGVKYVIAPLNDTYWEDAAVFLTMFYKILLSDEKSPWISYRNAYCGYKEAFGKISGAWRFYNYGELVQVDCG